MPAICIQIFFIKESNSWIPQQTYWIRILKSRIRNLHFSKTLQTKLRQNEVWEQQSLPSDSLVLFNNNTQHPHCHITHYHVDTATSYSTFEIINLLNINFYLFTSYESHFNFPPSSMASTNSADHLFLRPASVDSITQHFNKFKTAFLTPIVYLLFQPHVLNKFKTSD